MFGGQKKLAKGKHILRGDINVLMLGEPVTAKSQLLSDTSSFVAVCHYVKTAIALTMFGGQKKLAKGKHVLRGDINVLMLGEPVTAKSQLLSVERTVYTNGRGKSITGQTVAMAKDPFTRKWMLALRALLLADRGICLIDQFNNTNRKDSKGGYANASSSTHQVHNVS
ncbi:hypothetical protein CTI12_AA007530 [Artemisia annua]|uniref:MCM C-terminal AAA(+) ATPase domain-containing protein n=1 Tax=Artemisia annua TaxID=35608 RepID=A0A2U1QNA7_ARTAN|nr:hypothetical protein CTI12_AA007530 [Artemisia annua]